MQSTLRKLDIAYECAIKGIRGFPKFKKKNKEVQSIEFPQNAFALFDKKLSKVPKLGEIKTKFHRKFFGQIKTCHITKSPSHEYHIHFVVDDFIPQPKYKTEGVNLTGVDLGINDLAITSTGKKYENNKFLKKKLHQLKKAQKVLSRRSLKKKKLTINNKKMFGPFSKDEPLKEFTETVNVYSNRREKARLQVAKIHRDITNCREDHLHKVSKQLVDENEGLVFETLNIKGMVKNHKLAQAIYDCAWYKLINFCKFKADRQGKMVIQIDTFFASSKKCLKCGHKYHGLTLDERNWICEECGTYHDRDVNAAINILMEGYRILPDKIKNGDFKIQERKPKIQRKKPTGPVGRAETEMPLVDRPLAKTNEIPLVEDEIVLANKLEAINVKRDA